MSQHDFEIANQGFPSFRSDLNSGLQALASNSAGATEPSTTYAYQFWYDSTANLLKMRNTDDDAWITLAYFDQTNDEWEVRSAVIQAVDSAGVVIKTDDGTTRLTIADSGAVSINTSLDVDNIKIDDNTISSTDTNGNITLDPNGTGDINLSADVDVTGTVTADDNVIIQGASTTGLTITAGASNSARILFGDTGDIDIGSIYYYNADDSMQFTTNTSEAMRIDSSGNLLVSKTSANTNTAGVEARADGLLAATKSGAKALNLNRLTDDGDIAVFQKDGTKVGSIGTEAGDLTIGTGDTGLGFKDGGPWIGPWNMTTNAARDNAIDLGASGVRFDDIWATNGTIQTSDRNDKQDIEELSEAEQRVAVAAKGLLRKFRWKDKVAEKGDDARIHFGIIAQDLQAAFEAEGLDAGRYAMFISSTWWETYTDVPAVEAVDAVYETVVIPAVTEERLVSEAVLDEEGNEIEAAVYETVVVEEETAEERLVSEAIEAQEAYTRTDIYDTAEEAPEGAVERTRLGVRYPELLAFIIAAI